MPVLSLTNQHKQHVLHNQEVLSFSRRMGSVGAVLRSAPLLLVLLLLLLPLQCLQIVQLL